MCRLCARSPCASPTPVQPWVALLKSLNNNDTESLSGRVTTACCPQGRCRECFAQATRGHGRNKIKGGARKGGQGKRLFSSRPPVPFKHALASRFKASTVFTAQVWRRGSSGKYCRSKGVPRETCNCGRSCQLGGIIIEDHNPGPFSAKGSASDAAAICVSQ